MPLVDGCSGLFIQSSDFCTRLLLSCQTKSGFSSPPTRASATMENGGMPPSSTVACSASAPAPSSFGSTHHGWPAPSSMTPSAPTSSLCEWMVWQLVDSSLPTGGFAHSYGLEAAMQLGEYHLKASSEEQRMEGLLLFCRATMAQQARLLLPIVTAAHTDAEAHVCKHAHSQTYGHGQTQTSAHTHAHPQGSNGPCLDVLGVWRELDSQCNALLTTEGGRRASIAQGQALLRLAYDAFPSVSMQHRKVLKAVRDEIRQGQSRMSGHQAPVLGYVCGSLGIPLHTTSRMFVFLILRDVIAAATRLGLTGPLRAVGMQMSLYGDAEEIVHSCGAAAPVQDNPLLDLIQGAHEKLYSRLFNS